MTTPSPADPLAIYLAAMKSSSDVLVAESERQHAVAADDATDAASRRQARLATTRLDEQLERLALSREASLACVARTSKPPGRRLVDAAVRMAGALADAPNDGRHIATLIEIVAVFLGDAEAPAIGESSTLASLTQPQKQRLRDLLRKSEPASADGTRHKITLLKKSTSEIRQGDAGGAARTIQVEVRKKRVFVGRDPRDGAAAEDAQASARAEAAAAEEARRQFERSAPSESRETSRHEAERQAEPHAEQARFAAERIEAERLAARSHEAAATPTLRGGLLGGAPRATPPLPPIAFRGGPPPATRGAPPPVDPVRSADPAPTAAAAVADRYVNVALEDTPADAILQVGTWYTLAFDIDVAARADVLAATPFAEDTLFAEGVDEIAVTVQLDSADFDLPDPIRTLRVPRSGTSRNKARFDLAPKHDGPSTITATLHKEGNFVQSIAIRFVVGGMQPVPIETTARGRPAASAAMLKPRDVGIRLALADGGYDCAVWGAVSSGARLPLQPAYLASAVEALRRELMKVVMYQDANGAYVFQTGIDIADVDRDAALKTMARAGALLFQKLFFGPAAGDDSKRVGTFLRQVASDPAKRLDLQVVAEVAPIPWGLLYVGDASAGATLDWDLFLGMRHVIEEIPLQTTMDVLDSEIASDPRLSVSVNVNSGIDAQLGGSYVADTNAYWAKAQASRQRVGVTSRSTSADVMHALADASTDDQILYFYCHAESAALGDTGGPDASALVLTDARITLADLALDAPTTTTLRGQPLVFINACESAELSPAFYDGFVPYFMAKGARGVIGTQCKTPALFAVEWASRFFDRFLGGAALGETVLDLRREFLVQHGNPLGLLYAVHCDGDTRIDPALG